jgi:hypothetical protein
MWNMDELKQCGSIQASFNWEWYDCISKMDSLIRQKAARNENARSKPPIKRKKRLKHL